MTSIDICMDTVLDSTDHHYYNSLPDQNNKESSGCYTRRTLVAPQVDKFSQKTKICLKTIAIVFVILVITICSLYSGYVLGKNKCKGQSVKHKSNETKFTATPSAATKVETNSLSGLTTSFSKTIPSVTTKDTLEGKTFRIITKNSSRHWHYDGGTNKYVSGKWQPDDVYTEFQFVQMPDGTFKIKSVGGQVYIFDGYGVEGTRSVYLNGMDNTDDDHMRFRVTMVTENVYRIRTKATGRYVRMDPDLHVSTRYNIEDSNSLFLFTETKDTLEGK